MTTINLESTFTIHPDTLSRTIDEEEILLSLKSNTYFGLNDTGAVIWAGIKEGQSAGELAASISKTYDIPLEKAQEDTLSLLRDLVARKLIVVKN